MLVSEFLASSAAAQAPAWLVSLVAWIKFLGEALQPAAVTFAAVLLGVACLKFIVER